MKALILVGGFGTRLRPLTLSVPKPIVEFANKPSIIHQLEALKAVGVDEVVLAVNYQPELMSACMNEWSKKLGMKVTYSLETEPLGTAGPLALAANSLNTDVNGNPSDEPFFVLNSDVICPFPFEKFLAFHRAHGQEGTILVTEVTEPSKDGVVVADETGKIQRFVEKPQVFVGNKINAGIYIFNPSILKRIKVEPTSIEKQIFPAMASEGQLYSMVLDGFWMDIGQPKDFITGTKLYLNYLAEAKPELLHTGDGIIGPVLVDPTAKIGKNCTIGPHVSIGKGVVIGDGVRIKGAVLLDGSRVGDNSFVDSAIIGWQSHLGKWNRTQNTTVIGQNVKVKDEVLINGARILPHKDIDSSIYVEGTIVM